jgi:hypothetical protein
MQKLLLKILKPQHNIRLCLNTNLENAKCRSSVVFLRQFVGLYLISRESVTVQPDEPGVPSQAEIIPLEPDTDHTGVGRLQRLPWSFYPNLHGENIDERNTCCLPKKNR